MTEYSYEQHFVAFFDILGFKEIIGSAKTSEQAVEKIQFFNEALQASREIFKRQWSWEVDEFTVKMFSDCICVSVPAKHENVDAFFKAITYVQTTFAYNRIMLRGGVTVGRHFINNDLIFGEALVEAYKLEMSTKHPHIAVSQKLHEFIVPAEPLEFGEDPEQQMKLNNAAHFQHAYVFKLAHDPVLFLDYLQFQPDENDTVGHIREHRDWIISALEEHRGNPSVRPKFEWARRYHNQWCSIYEKHRSDLDELLIDESYV